MKRAANGSLGGRRRWGRSLLAVAVLLLAMNIVFYSLVVRPRIIEHEDLAGSRLRFNAELSAAERVKGTLSGYYANLSSVEENIENFYKNTLGTKQERLIAVQQEINEIGSEFGIDPESVNYSNLELNENGLEKFTIQVLLVGDYADLRNFLERVENSETFLIVESIGLTGTKEGGLQLQLNIDISTYFNAPWLKDAPGPSRRGSRRTRA